MKIKQQKHKWHDIKRSGQAVTREKGNKPSKCKKGNDICMRLEPDVAHQGLVLRPPHVLLLPASVAEVVEAGEVPRSRRYQLLQMKEQGSRRSWVFQAENEVGTCRNRGPASCCIGSTECPEKLTL